MISDHTKQKLRGAVRSRTNYVALALVVLGFLLEPDQQKVIAGLLGPELMPRLVSLLGLIVAVLRWHTTESLAEKAPEDES